MRWLFLWAYFKKQFHKKNAGFKACYFYENIVYLQKNSKLYTHEKNTRYLIISYKLCFS